MMQMRGFTIGFAVLFVLSSTTTARASSPTSPPTSVSDGKSADAKSESKTTKTRKKAKKRRWVNPNRAKAAPKNWRAPKSPGVQQSVEKAHGLSLSDRLVATTDAFVGAPYGISPLGEGAGEDTDPRIRFDVFDCTTFVETGIALALSDDLTAAEHLLDVIRYRRGEPNFLARRHFPEAEWIPELVELGFLEDITRQVGGDAVQVETKRIDPKVWDRRKRPSHLELPTERIPVGTFSLDVWPLDLARAGRAKIPAGTVLNLVRVDYKSVPVRVSHQGLIIERDGKQFIRHAADRMYHRVVDEPLDYFFHRMQQYKKWPVAGVNLVAVREPTAGRGSKAQPAFDTSSQ